MDAEYNGWPYQRGGPPGPPPELIPARAWVKSTHHAWFESATLATFGRLARALTKNVIFLFPKSKIDTTNRKAIWGVKNASRAPGQGPSSACQSSKLFKMVDLVEVGHFFPAFTFVVKFHLKITRFSTAFTGFVSIRQKRSESTTMMPAGVVSVR